MYLTLKDLLANKAEGFVGATVISVTLRDYGVSFNLFPRLSLEISEYWELHDQNGTTLDRAVTAEKRESFFLFRLIGQKVVAMEKQLDAFFIHFDKGSRFVVHFDPRAQKDEREEERRRIFGSVKNSWDGL